MRLEEYPNTVYRIAQAAAKGEVRFYLVPAIWGIGGGVCLVASAVLFSPKRRRGRRAPAGSEGPP